MLHKVVQPGTRGGCFPFDLLLERAYEVKVVDGITDR